MKKISKQNVCRNPKKPWLSVIVPIYNAERFLPQCIESILNQSFTNYELLLVDDGSTDSSSQICTQYAIKDNRIRYLKKENGGSYQSRIYGAAHALGTYITFCDADDYYPTKKAFGVLYRTAYKAEYSLIQFGFFKKYNHLHQKCRTVNQPLAVTQQEFLTHEYPKLLCSFWDASHLTTNVWNKLYHRNLLSNLPDSLNAEKIFWGDDQVLNLYLLENCDNALFIPDVLYAYRQFSGATNKFSLHTMHDLDSIKRYQQIFLNRYQGTDKDKMQNILYSEVAGWFYAYVQQGLAYLNEDKLKELITRRRCGQKVGQVT